MDSLIAERVQRELYLRPFEIAVREANPWALMTSYNLLNGVHCDGNTHTLKTILRGEWGYDGFVTWSKLREFVANCSLVPSFRTGAVSTRR